MAEPEGERRGPASKLVADVVSEAIDRAGKAMALARKIEPLIGRTYADRTVSAWGRGDVMPPADAVLAAAQVMGVSLDEKLGIGRIPTALEQQVADLQSQVNQQRRASAALERRLAELAATLSVSPVSSAAADVDRLPDLSEAEGVLVQLEARLIDLGGQLGRRWGERGSYPDPGTSVSERVIRSIGRLEARMAEVGVPPPPGGYPSRPTSSDEEVLRRWVHTELPVLERQLALVEERAVRFGASHDAASEAN